MVWSPCCSVGMVPASCTNAIAIIAMGSPISSWCLNTPKGNPTLQYPMGTILPMGTMLPYSFHYWTSPIVDLEVPKKLARQLHGLWQSNACTMWTTTVHAYLDVELSSHIFALDKPPINVCHSALSQHCQSNCIPIWRPQKLGKQHRVGQMAQNL